MTKYFDKEKNQKERVWFIEYWANYMKTVPDNVWASQQAKLINSALESTKDKNIKRVQKIRMTGN